MPDVLEVKVTNLPKSGKSDKQFSKIVINSKGFYAEVPAVVFSARAADKLLRVAEKVSTRK